MVCTEIPRTTIAGGFVLVPVPSLMAAWKACRSRPLGIADFRTWLACHEMVARRRHLDDGRAPAYGVAELARLLGVAERRARASIARLVGAGLLTWAADAITFPDHVFNEERLPVDSIGAGRGQLAIPRRFLRFLAAGARPALIATALGTLFRCLSRRRAGFDGRGRVKASWVARQFGVSIPAVKAARRDLIAIAWLAVEQSDQWSLNRFGRAYRIDLAWAAPRPERCPTPIPPSAGNGATPIPPDLHPDPLPEREIHQEPPSGRSAGTGVRLKAGERSGELPTPTLDDIRPEDLTDTARTLKLFDQAVERKIVGPCEADWLRFVSLVDHARAVGKANPPGLFAHLLRGRCWRFITDGDEDSARRRLREHDHGPARPSPLPAARASSFVADAPAGCPTLLGDLMARFRSAGS